MARERTRFLLCCSGETVAVYKGMRYNNNWVFIRYTGALRMRADKDKKMKQTASAVVLAAGSSSRMGFDKLGFDLGARRSWAAASGRSTPARGSERSSWSRAGTRPWPGGRPPAAASRSAWCRAGTPGPRAPAGVEAAGGELVAIHDAARPFVSQAVIEAALQGAAQWGAAAPAVPLKDTVKRGTPGTAAPCRRPAWSM